MNKNNLKICLLISILIIVISLFIYNFYHNYRIKNANKIVVLATNEVEVYSEITLKKLIKTINGKLISNKKINTKKLGKTKINFEYITNENIKVPYMIEINIVDKTPPIISQIKDYTITVNDDKDIAKELFCGDNYDSNPNCFLEGEYDITTPGEYNLTFIGIDSSNNKNTNNFILRVQDENQEKSNNSQEVAANDFNEIVKKYKTSKTKIGIDVSHWQGNINYEKVKSSKVEFAYIRVGRGDGIGKKYILDKKFKQNIEGFNKVGIPVGVYFYSSANSKKDAIKEAKWVIEQIKDYNVELEVVFDWENWQDFQDYNLSFYKLTEVSKSFMDTIKKNGYKGMLYSSKNYLETIWYPINNPIWLAHYTKETDYQGKYKVWQLCSNGKVAGIDDNLVDINIMYN